MAGRKYGVLFLWLLLLVFATQVQAFQAQVSNVYYSDSVRTVNNFDFTDGTKSADTITIPDSFVTKPSGESTLSYTYGLYPGTKNLTLSWTKPDPCVLQNSIGYSRGAAVISTTPSLPDLSSAQTAYTYSARLKNFTGMGEAGKTYIAYVGMGSDVEGNQPNIAASWLPNGNLQIMARVGDDDSPDWTSGTVTQTGLTPASTTLECKIENTGSAINFYYNLNSGGWTLLGTFGSGEGYAAAYYKGFPNLYPFVNLEVNDPYSVRSGHQDTNYYSMIYVDDPGQAVYESVSVASSGTACGDTLASTALAYSNGQWRLNSNVNISTGSTPSCFPEYTFTAVKKAGGTDTVTRTVTGYVVAFPSYLQPSNYFMGADYNLVGGAPTFSWSGINGATSYYVQLLDATYNYVWSQSVDAPVTRLDYTGVALTSGTYYYYVYANIETGGQYNMSVASGSFTYDPTAIYAYTFSVKDASGNPLEGVKVEMLGNSSVNTTTRSDGRFMIDGLPLGAAVSLKMSKTGYAPTYTQDMYYTIADQYRNVTGYKTLSNVLYPSAAIASWGVAAGYGVINGRVLDQYSLSNMSGAVVTCTSALGRTYTVKYLNDSGVLVDGPSTFANGVFMILNVVDGDTVIATASKSGYTFPPKTYRTHADAVTQSSIFGVSPVRSCIALGGYLSSLTFADSKNEIASIAFSSLDPTIKQCFGMNYDSFNRKWINTCSLNSSGANFSTTATITITNKTGEMKTEDYSFSGFVGIPTNILPASGSTVYGRPTFSLTGSALSYDLDLRDPSNLKRIWSDRMMTSTSVTYDGFFPLNGSYAVIITSYDAAGNYSLMFPGTSLICYMSSLYADFTGAGIWQYDGSNWSRLNVGETSKMTASGNNLYANFEGYGLWQWNGTQWSQLNPGLAANMTASGTNLYVDFAGYGLWVWNGTTWTQINTGNTNGMTASGNNVYANFAGYGLWQWNGSTWNQINSGEGTGMTASGTNLYANFTGYGIWQWNGTTWNQINTGNSTGMTASGTNLYANFAGYGLWQWNGTTWTQLNAGNTTGMAATGGNLYGNFAGYGLWKWDGSTWSQINTGEPAIMAGGE